MQIVKNVNIFMRAVMKRLGKGIGAMIEANSRYARNHRDMIFYLSGFTALFLLFPTMGYASVESTLGAIQTRMIGTILPLVAILGIAFAACSFAFGSENARRHAILAAVGALIGFGAPAIIQFIRDMVQ